jgi:hypothetical protein
MLRVSTANRIKKVISTMKTTSLPFQNARHAMNPGLSSSEVKLGAAIQEFTSKAVTDVFVATIHGSGGVLFRDIRDRGLCKLNMEKVVQILKTSNAFNLRGRPVIEENQIIIYWYTGDMIVLDDHSPEELSLMRARIVDFFERRFNVLAEIDFYYLSPSDHLSSFYEEIYRMNDMVEILGIKQTRRRRNPLV